MDNTDELTLPAGFAAAYPEAVALLEVPEPNPEHVERGRADGAFLEYERQEAARLTIDSYAEYLRLDTLGIERTNGDEDRYRELGARHGLDGAGLTPERVDMLQARRDSGETLDRADTIALDAANRISRPRNRVDRRYDRLSIRGGRNLSDRVFRRALDRPRRHDGRRHVRRARRGVRVASRGSPRRRDDPDPEHVVRPERIAA